MIQHAKNTSIYNSTQKMVPKMFCVKKIIADTKITPIIY